MKGYDPQKAAQVWERVQGQKREPERQPGDELPALIMAAQTAAMTFAHLARQASVKEAAVLQRLAREEQAHAACLKGMYILMTGKKPEVRTPPVEKETRETALRRCYGEQMRSMRACEARREDGEYGHVFARLAQQEREHCCALLELIGSLGKK